MKEILEKLHTKIVETYIKIITNKKGMIISDELCCEDHSCPVSIFSPVDKFQDVYMCEQCDGEPKNLIIEI